MGISKEQIIEVASLLFQERGYHATSIQDIAERLGVTKAALYYYIKNKELTLYEIHNKAMQTIETRMQEVLKRNEGPKEKLAAIIFMHIQALVDESPIITVFFNERNHLLPEHLEVINKRRRQYEENTAKVIYEGIEAGVFKKDIDAMLATYAVIGMCNWLYQWYNPAGRLKPQEIAGLYSKIVLHGLLLQS